MLAVLFRTNLFQSPSFISFRCPLCFADHRVRPGALPGTAHGVHRQLPEHHGVWDGEHPLPEDRVWRVRTPLVPPPSLFI